MTNVASIPSLCDEFPDTPARRAVVAVVRACDAISGRMGPHYAGFGLTPAQFQILIVLNRLRHARLTQRRLGSELYVSLPNLTVMLSRLEEADLIKRTINPADRREKFVRISDRGRRLLRKIWKVQPAQPENTMAGLSDDERRQLAQFSTA